MITVTGWQSCLLFALVIAVALALAAEGGKA